MKRRVIKIWSRFDVSRFTTDGCGVAIGEKSVIYFSRANYRQSRLRLPGGASRGDSCFSLWHQVTSGRRDLRFVSLPKIDGRDMVATC
jgi:hypothetical protein